MNGDFYRIAQGEKVLVLNNLSLQDMNDNKLLLS